MSDNETTTDTEPTAEDNDTGEPTETDTLGWLLAEARHQLDNPDTNAEAARHRLARREAETARDDLATRLENMQRSVIDNHIAAIGLKPAAVWASGAQLGDLLGEDGTPNLEAVEQAAENARDSLGIEVFTAPRDGLRSGASAPQPKRDKWVEAFAPQDG